MCNANRIDPPSPTELGFCAVCGGNLYADDQHRELGDYACPLCDEPVCENCSVKCAQCEIDGCKSCMIYDDEYGEWFCDTSNGAASLQAWQRLALSECRKEWLLAGSSDADSESTQTINNKPVPDTLYGDVCGPCGPFKG